jgi:AcrR family transcriptional regulator
MSTAIQKEMAMKVSREQVALNRERIIETAARLFREKGYDGIGVADLMKSAGLTHGGFYGHFDSKEDLLAEAATHALKKSVQRWEGYLAEGRDTALEKISDGYLTAQHRDHPEKGCSVTAQGTACHARRRQRPDRGAAAADAGRGRGGKAPAGAGRLCGDGRRHRGVARGG